MAVGGLGNLAWGRHQYGAPSSVIEPKFHSSVPRDNSSGVNVNTWVEFYLYAYSSYIDVSQIAANTEVSEDVGVTYAPANADPYTILARRYDGQKIWIKIRKSSPWRSNTTVVIRVTLTDDFGHDVVKTAVVEWP